MTTNVIDDVIYVAEGIVDALTSRMCANPLEKSFGVPLNSEEVPYARDIMEKVAEVISERRLGFQLDTCKNNQNGTMTLVYTLP